MLRPSRPAYAPVHYVNPPGTRPLPPWVLAAVGVAVLLAAMAAAFFLIMNFSPTPVGTPGDWVTPSTYGPPPTTTGVRGRG
jgi:hypothetical protein